MSGGSRAPDDSTDQQCPHCLLWYDSRGIDGHKDTCDWKGRDWAPGEKDGVDVGGGPDALDDVDESDTPTPESGQGTPSEPEGDTAETDGGNPALAAPERRADGGSAEVDVDDEPTCPDCGGHHYFDASEHTEYEYGCADCSDAESWVVWDE